MVVKRGGDNVRHRFRNGGIDSVKRKRRSLKHIRDAVFREITGGRTGKHVVERGRRRPDVNIRLDVLIIDELLFRDECKCT